MQFLAKIKKKRKLMVIAADVTIMLTVSALLYGAMPTDSRGGRMVFFSNIG